VQSCAWEASQKAEPLCRYGLLGIYWSAGRSSVQQRSEHCNLRTTGAGRLPRSGLGRVARCSRIRGELDQAFSWLNRAYQEHDSTIVGLPPITIDPDMKNLRGDPRYEAFLGKMNLP